MVDFWMNNNDIPDDDGIDVEEQKKTVMRWGMHLIECTSRNEEMKCNFNRLHRTFRSTLFNFIFRSVHQSLSLHYLARQFFYKHFSFCIWFAFHSRSIECFLFRMVYVCCSCCTVCLCVYMKHFIERFSPQCGTTVNLNDIFQNVLNYLQSAV